MSSTIETFEQFRKCIGMQRMPNSSEFIIIKRIFNDEMSSENPDLLFALTLIYLAGKLKGSGVVTYEDIDVIIKSMIRKELRKKKSHLAGNEVAFI